MLKSVFEEIKDDAACAIKVKAVFKKASMERDLAYTDTNFSTFTRGITKLGKAGTSIGTAFVKSIRPNGLGSEPCSGAVWHIWQS